MSSAREVRCSVCGLVAVVFPSEVSAAVVLHDAELWRETCLEHVERRDAVRSIKDCFAFNAATRRV